MWVLECKLQGWGKTVVVGVDKPGSQLNFSSYEVLHSGKIIMGSLFGGLKPKSDIPILVKRYMDKVNFEKFHILFLLISFPRKICSKLNRLRSLYWSLFRYHIQWMPHMKLCSISIYWFGNENYCTFQEFGHYLTSTFQHD